MRNSLFVALLIVICPAVASAQTVRAPALTPGDSWTYENGFENRGSLKRTTHEIITLSRADDRLIAVEVHPVGQTNPGPERLVGPDWSRVRSVNGRQTVVNRPLSFPLSQGKSWTVAYAESNPPDRTHTREQLTMVYKVVGWQEVTVPAGTYRALKIEGDGTWTADLPTNVVVARGRAPNGANVAVSSLQGPRVTSGRFFKAFWYVPDVHRWVKSEEDFYDNNGVRNQHTTSDLEAFRPGDPRAASPPTGPETDTPAVATKPSHPTHVKAHRTAPPAAHSPKGPTPQPDMEQTNWLPGTASKDT